jgi:hypothetical protein
MNSSKVILALLLGATAWGQVRMAQPPAQPPVATSPNIAPAASPAAKSSRPRSARTTHSRTTHHATVTRHVSQRATVASKGGEKPKPAGRGQRDPFVSPVVDRAHTPIVCTGSGKQCLEVGEVSLHGVVRGPTGFIAVVVNGDHTYFLRENDPLANGLVERITKDSIILRERYFDDAGRSVTREVTRKLGASTV